MTDSLVIDLDVALGRPAGRGLLPASLLDVETLLQTMDEAGVDRAVAYHVVAKEHAPAIGNQLLLEELAENPRLIPAFVLLPPFTGEQPDIRELAELLAFHGVRFARLFPAAGLDGHRFAMREWCIGPVLTMLEEARIPVGVDFSLFRRGEPPWDDVFDVCSHHPDLEVVLMDVQGRNNRSLYPLLDRFPRLSVCTGGLNVHCGIEDICERFGADRLVYGSNTPARSMAAARFVVDRADIDGREAALILGGNACARLGLRPEMEDA